MSEMHHDPVNAEYEQQDGEDRYDGYVPSGYVFTGFVSVKKVDDLCCDKGPGEEHELIVLVSDSGVAFCKMNEHMGDAA